MTDQIKNIYKIVHISDLHCGSSYFIPHMLERVVEEINAVKPDLVVATGDITDQGFKSEYVAASGFLAQIECKNVIIVPGNHDSRNVGYVHFEDYFGELDKKIEIGPFALYALDSSEPDLDEGRIGREKYDDVTDFFTGNEKLKIVAFHHHLIPIPGTGRERNILVDAGDFLRVLVENDVHLVLSGHRHVPNIWRVEDMYVINAGTASTRRVRGYSVPSYNIIEMHTDEGILRVYRKVPFESSELVFETGRFENVCYLNRG